MSRFTVFLDRDGVFNHHHERPMKKLDLFDYASAAFARLNRDDVQTSLCTNQPWVGMGLLSARKVRATNEGLQATLSAEGGRLDHIEAAYACFPHRRRKPRPGMLEDAATHFAAQGSPVDKKRAVMIGDKPKDAMAGNAFGIPAILLATTYDQARLETEVADGGLDAVVAADLTEAVALVLSRLDNA